MWSEVSSTSAALMKSGASDSQETYLSPEWSVQSKTGNAFFRPIALPSTLNIRCFFLAEPEPRSNTLSSIDMWDGKETSATSSYPMGG